MHFRENFRPKRKFDFGLENALAGYVRRRWPDKPIVHAQKEWDLSESEAAKVVYANASKNTLKRLLHHPRGGFPLFVELIADACGTTLEQYIEAQAEKAAHERRTWEAEERRLAALAARVSGDGRQPWRGARPARRGRAETAALGGDAPPS